jgi:NAD(P)-dependent dehydrogenase (short-subunit alcohol dehydrogenase family)
VIGQVVLITGALSVIGRATAKAFAREGARIVISELSDEEGTKQADQLRSSRVEAEFFRADIRQDEDVQGLVEFTVDRFGSLGAAVNCAETGAGLGLVKEQSPESYAMTFETNVLGTILCLKHELAAMTRQRRGTIVNLSRTAGHQGGRSGADLRRQQARSRRTDEICRVGGGSIRDSYKCGRGGIDRDRDGGPRLCVIEAAITAGRRQSPCERLSETDQRAFRTQPPVSPSAGHRQISAHHLPDSIELARPKGLTLPRLTLR